MKTLTTIMKIKLISLVLFGILFVSSSMAEEPLVISDNQLKIERVALNNNYILNFYKGSILFASYYKTPNEQDPAGYVLEILADKIQITSPIHFSKEGTLLTSIKSPEQTRTVEFGEATQVTPDVFLTKFGNINIFGHILTPAGYAFLNLKHPKSKIQNLIYLVNPEHGNNILTPTDKFLTQAREALYFLTRTGQIKNPSQPDIMTNSDEPLGLDDGLLQIRSSGSDCEPVPDCCCKPEERAEDGKCYRPILLVAGAWGDTSGFEEILDKIEDSPCMKNTKFFGYADGDRKDASLKTLAYDAAIDIVSLSESCGGSPVTTHGYCHGGRILEQAMGVLAEDGKPKFSITTYNAAYEGTHKVYPFLNAMSFGIAGLFLKPTIRDYMNNKLPPPNEIPDNVTSFTAHVAGDDHDFSIESQKAGPKGADYSVDEEGNHYNTLSRNFEYILCCGDGAIEPARGEECEVEGSQCNATGLCNGLPLIGTCNSECKCDADSYTCSDLIPIPSPTQLATPIE
jgi:hypothetical protein